MTLSSLTVCLQGLQFNVMRIPVPIVLLAFPIGETILDLIILVLILAVNAKAKSN